MKNQKRIRLFIFAFLIISALSAAFSFAVSAEESGIYFEDYEDFSNPDILSHSSQISEGWYETVNATGVNKGGKSYCEITGDGQLFIHADPSDSNFGEVGYKFGTTITEGVVELGFKVKFVGGSNYQSRFYVGGENIFGVAGGRLYSGNKNIPINDPIDITFRYNGGTGSPVSASFNGKPCEELTNKVLKNSKYFSISHFSNKLSEKSSVDLYFDDFYIKHYKIPKLVSANISDGETAVALNAPELTFNIPIDSATLEFLKLEKNGKTVEDAEFILSEDGTKITLKTPLEYSAPYKIEAKTGLKSTGGVEAAPFELRFHTMHKPAAVLTDAPVSFDKTSLAAGETVTASGVFSNPTENTEYVDLIVALYTSENIMEDIRIKRVELSAGAENVTGSLSITLPGDVAGKKLRAYTWSGFDETDIVSRRNELN